ncbi:MAG: 3-ketoacyl-ACP reductase [Pseudomonadota bacterium]
MSRPVALVTGARRGIGLAIAKSLAGAGFDLVITGTRQDEVSDAACDEIRQYGGQAMFIASDVADLDDHDRTLELLFDRFGRLDCLVNNAGIGSPTRGDILDLTPDAFDRVIGVNLRGTVFFTQNAVRRMLAEQANGHARSVIHVTSVSAAMASTNRAEYCMSKAGLAMWSRSLALRLAELEIGVFEVRPGIIRSDMTAGVADKYDRLIDEGLVPARRWGEGSDIGNVVVALATGAFGFATGSVIDVDGALSVAQL